MDNNVNMVVTESKKRNSEARLPEELNISMNPKEFIVYIGSRKE